VKGYVKTSSIPIVAFFIAAATNYAENEKDIAETSAVSLRLAVYVGTYDYSTHSRLGNNTGFGVLICIDTRIVRYQYY
jgi:hypothetical protein